MESSVLIDALMNYFLLIFLVPILVRSEPAFASASVSAFVSLSASVSMLLIDELESTQHYCWQLEEMLHKVAQ